MATIYDLKDRKKDSGIYDVLRDRVGGWINVYPDLLFKHMDALGLSCQEVVLLLNVMNSTRDPGKDGWMTNAELMRRMGKSESVIKRVKSSLREKGFMKTYFHSGTEYGLGNGDYEHYDFDHMIKAIADGIVKCVEQPRKGGQGFRNDTQGERVGFRNDTQGGSEMTPTWGSEMTPNKYTIQTSNPEEVIQPSAARTSSPSAHLTIEEPTAHSRTEDELTTDQNIQKEQKKEISAKERKDTNLESEEDMQQELFTITEEGMGKKDEDRINNARKVTEEREAERKGAREAMQVACNKGDETHARQDEKAAKRAMKRLSGPQKPRKASAPFHLTITSLMMGWGERFTRAFPNAERPLAGSVYKMMQGNLNTYMQHAIEGGSKFPEKEAEQNINMIMDFLIDNWKFIGKNWFKGKSSYPAPSMMCLGSMLQEAKAYNEAKLVKQTARAYKESTPDFYSYPEELQERLYKASDVLKKYEA
jgi:hypothetical protein